MTQLFNHAVIHSPINTSVKPVVLRTETPETTQDIQIEIKKMNVNWPYFTGIILDERWPNSNHSKSHHNYCAQSFHIAWTFSTLWCVKTICCDDIIEHLPVSHGYLPFFLKTIVAPRMTDCRTLDYNDKRK